MREAFHESSFRRLMAWRSGTGGSSKAYVVPSGGWCSSFGGVDDGLILLVIKAGRCSTVLLRPRSRRGLSPIAQTVPVRLTSAGNYVERRERNLARSG
ncbi:hypothetical protein BN6_21040 [Saccharothrix espanaensis DSM 44229]|uniref:Uncharacterized protein n=1 Tax=Saccharothrix espanaensis (strain ATCC 51144 / DSM 44229 / JCM 9112 / NBRC 15066 / NRRL 15764) TaxID=1179773 RepID=K0JU24_SACES|nr:hypothetical protein BN6_21040 [Saccharothrix espanaensis DSM 44229]